MNEDIPDDCSARYLRNMVEKYKQLDIQRGSAMGRIAIALFGEKNNVTDEECVTRAQQIGQSIAEFRKNAGEMLASVLTALRDSLKAYDSKIESVTVTAERIEAWEEVARMGDEWLKQLNPTHTP